VEDTSVISGLETAEKNTDSKGIKLKLKAT
jgi:hypothetical protein